METRHVTDAVLMMAALPLDANVEFLTVMATNMPYIGRGLPPAVLGRKPKRRPLRTHWLGPLLPASTPTWPPLRATPAARQ
jgi:hypothetical protein